MDQILQCVLALILGIILGLAFGVLQRTALRRHEKLQQSGKLNTAWTVMPGSMRRVAFLLLGLAFVQLCCPMLFDGGKEWWISGGVVAGYGSLLFTQLRQIRSVSRP